MLNLLQINIYEMKQYLENEDWDNIMNTTYRFETLKKCTRYIKLNIIYSTIYYESDIFRNLINSKILNPLNQLSLKLDYYNIEFSENDQTNNNEFDYIKLDALSIKYSNIDDLLTCKYIKKIDLTGCINITDLSPLCNIQEINLSNCTQIVDISSLKNANKVILSFCTNLVDVSPLKNVKYIFISNCHNITDISMLNNVITLFILHCNGEIDVSNLYTVKSLSILFCDNIIGKNKLIQNKKDNLFINL